MTEAHPYTLPGRGPGITLKSIHIKVEPEFKEALQAFAATESEKYGVKVAPATVLRDLLTRDDPTVRTKRTELRQRYREIKENNRHETNQPPLQQADLQ